ncbi:MAG: M67 family metallopeptidase [Sulfuricaulis sp.]|uniref:Mov34/MPN/PAD-1 family protein n=1 Tax=Sulfuricaulis sp. TaxID=2003553 RepID=UPI003C4555BF
MSVVRLPRSIVNQLLQLAQKSPEEEICGLISRDQRGFKKCYPVVNVADDKKHFFALDPKGQIEAIRSMREQGEELGAIFHSHPDSPPLPSLADIEQHEYPGVLYLIISLGKKGVPEMRGYHIHGREAGEVVITLLDDTPQGSSE